MRLHSILTTLSVGGLLALSGHGTTGITAQSFPHGSAAAAHERPQESPGQKIFKGKGNCFTCHGPAGKGTVLAPDLTDGEWLDFEEAPTRAGIEELVRRGVSRPVRHPAPMPAMGGARLSDDEISAVAEYVLTLSGGTDA